MTINWFDIVGFVGVTMMVIAYLLLQLNRLSSSAPLYSLLNAVGAFMVIISLIFDFNLPAFLVEMFWLFISLFGLLRPLVSSRAV